MLSGSAELRSKTDESQTKGQRRGAGALALRHAEEYRGACAVHRVVRAADGRTIACSANAFTTSCRKRGGKRGRFFLRFAFSTHSVRAADPPGHQHSYAADRIMSLVPAAPSADGQEKERLER